MSTLYKYLLGVQGSLLLANGAYMLLFPAEISAPTSPMAGTPISVIHAMSTSTISLGLTYLVAAYQSNQTYVVMGVPGRFLAAALFWSHGGAWKNVACYEAVWGAINFGALMCYPRRNTSNAKISALISPLKPQLRRARNVEGSYVKQGRSHQINREVEAMEFVRRHTSIPVPLVLEKYVIMNDADPATLSIEADQGSWFLMSAIPGLSLTDA